jgi:5-methylcytosine-specific restriction endonuclease McrA
MKICSACGIAKPPTEFHRRTGRLSGLVSKCKPCKALAAATYRSQNLAECRSRSLAWHNANRKRSIANTTTWQAANAETVAASRMAYRLSRRDELSAAWRKWRDGNRDIVRSLKAQRRAALKSATVGWADQKAIRSIYQQALRLSMDTGVEHQVDHVIPLQHPLVCGLHVETNLRPIPKAENLKKKNWWSPGETAPDRAPDLAKIGAR